VKNIQSRSIAAPAADVGALLDRLAAPDDVLWPGPPWPRLRLDRGLTIGSAGGHGPIRYRVSECEPGRRIRFAFEPTVGIHGYHELAVEPDRPQRCRLVHTISGRTRGTMRWRWPLVIRWLHEALLHELLDNAERAATGGLTGPRSRPGPWVRLLGRTRGVRAARR
jgi:hypothetical protein